MLGRHVIMPAASLAAAALMPPPPMAAEAAPITPGRISVPCVLPVCRSTGSELCFSVLECDWNRFRIRKDDAVSSKANPGPAMASWVSGWLPSGLAKPGIFIVGGRFCGQCTACDGAEEASPNPVLSCSPIPTLRSKVSIKYRHMAHPDDEGASPSAPPTNPAAIPKSGCDDPTAFNAAPAA